MRHHLPLFLPIAGLLSTGTVSAQQAGPSFGHARTRELAELGRLPSARDVVVRDIVNYRRHRLPLPKANESVALDVRFDRDSARAGDEVWLQVGYTTAPQGDRALAGPCAIALVVDVSGSMQEAGKMTAVQAGLRAFVDRLRADDEVSLVTFSTEAQVVEHRRLRGDGTWLRAAIERLTPGGNTNLHAGLMLGLDELAKGDTGNKGRRVIVLTDGIANTGVTEPDRIVADATRRAETAIDISTIGVGQNLDVPLLQRLADGSRGLFHFVADSTDVQKVFVAEADALLAAVARNVRLRIRMPDDLELVRVLHEAATVRAGAVELALPDFNAGVTGVVMVHCRARSDAPGEVGAELTFDDAAAKRTARLTANDRLTPKNALVDRGRVPDLDVLENAAIAVLAQGMADMAVACDARRWADADRALQRAIDDATRLHPGQEADLQRVREMATGHARTLRRYVDRFRDF